MSITCLKCGHQRAPGDPPPLTECPRCGAIYAKMAARAAAAAATAPVARAVEHSAAAPADGPRAAADTTPGLADFIATVDHWCHGRHWPARALLLGWLAWVGVNYLDHLAPRPWGEPYLYYTSLFDGINLGIHELGHVVFRPGGSFLTAAGGTLLQLLAPLSVIIGFLRQPDYYAVSVAGVWLASNLYGVARYMADARELILPLVTVGDASGPVNHDWNYMFFQLGGLDLLEWDTAIAGAVRVVAFVTLWGAIAAGGWMVWRMARG